MLPDIIKTEYEAEILSDNSNVYAPGDFYPSSDFIEYFLAQYDPDDVETIVVCMSNGTTSFPEEAMPYIEEALEKAMSEIEAKISKL